MAERRMLCKSIIDSDAFTDLPLEAQMLYVRLNLASDDDGFCDNPRSVMRLCGASNDAMRLLIAKKFVLTFERNDSFIVVIKHWRMNNYIRKDTYHESKYKEFMRELYYDENNAYSLNPGDGHRPCIPPILPPDPLPAPSRDESVTRPSRAREKPLTQDRLGKDRKDKVRLGKDRSGKEKGECEGEKPAPPDPDPQDAPGASLTPDKKRERIDYFLERIRAGKRLGLADPEGFVCRLAALEGITAAEIDERRAELERDQPAPGGKPP